MSNNNQANTTGQLTLCLRQTIDKARYLAEVHLDAGLLKGQYPAACGGDEALAEYFVTNCK